MNQTFITFVLGFSLGVKHAFDADHLVAVSTIMSRLKNPLRAALIGTFWGIGHTTTLFLVGIIVLLLKIQIPENISLFLEMVVGLMLVFLGIKSFHQHFLIHIHPHRHQRQLHSHLHFPQDKHHYHQHYQSFLVGTVHGLAGSGALMLLVLATIPTLLAGIYYIFLFGIGSTLGMTLISILFGWPLSYSTKKFPQIDKYLNLVFGVISMIFGLLIIYEIGFKRGLFF